jgi:hypothetical protein
VSSSLHTSMPAARRAAAVTPSPETSVRLNVPSYTVDEPHDGLRALRTARVAPTVRATATAASAPRR